MKRYLILFLFIVLAGCAWLFNAPPTGPIFPGEVTILAQSLPVTKTIQWDANPATDEVTHYNPKLDGASLGQPTGTSVQATFTTQGPHTLTVSATNIWGTSAEATLHVVVKIPDSVKQIRLGPGA